jgi:uncharacterized protein YbjT (DUF2867 family)
MSARTTLVLGGTGKTGRRVAERLRSRGWPVRIGSRFAEVPFDWNQPTTWNDALANVSQAYVSYYPDVAVPGTANVIRSFTEVAISRGVRRIVLLSGRGEPEAERCEQVVQASGVEWAIVRASWFNQNFSEGHFFEPILEGELALPAGAIGEPFVDADDIAEVAAASLIDDRHAGEVYEVTGPRLWTFAEAIAEIARVTRRDIRFTEIGIQDYAAGMEGAGVPRELVALITYLFTEVLDGRNASVQDGVQRALGRPPRDFSAYVRDTAATGVWNRNGRRPARDEGRRRA